MKKIIVITGASSGFGALAARALAAPGTRSTPSMRETTGRNAPQSRRRQVCRRSTASTCAPSSSTSRRSASVDAAHRGRSSPRTAASTWSSTTPATWCSVRPKRSRRSSSPSSTTSTCSARSASTAPRCRSCARRAGPGGLGVSSSVRGGTPPYLAPYFAAKAGDGRARGQLCRRARAVGHRDLDHRARRVHQGHEPLRACRLARRRGARRPSTSGAPTRACRTRSSRGWPRSCRRTRTSTTVADAIVRVVDTAVRHAAVPVHIDPSQDGAEIVNAVADRVRAELLRRIGLEDLLTPQVSTRT